MIADLINRPCTITRRTTDAVNTYGGDSQAEETAQAVCELQQRARSDKTSGGEISTSSWVLFLLPGTQIGAADLVTVDDVVFEVDGEPWEVRDPWTGEPDHIEATVARAGGTDHTEGGS